MAKEPAIEFDYFSAVEGHAVSRFGTGVQIGATRGPDGFTVNPDIIVPIPKREVAQHSKAYADAVRLGELTRRTKEEFDVQQKETEAQEAEDDRKLTEAREAEKAEAEEAEADKSNDKPELSDKFAKGGDQKFLLTNEDEG